MRQWLSYAIVSVIVGHRRMRTQGNVPEQVYVRLPGDNQTWLADGGLQADTDPHSWLARDIINISHALISKVVATKNGETIELTRDGDKLKVTKPAEHPIRAPPGKTSLGIDWKPPSEIARAP